MAKPTLLNWNSLKKQENCPVFIACAEIPRLARKYKWLIRLTLDGADWQLRRLFLRGQMIVS
jgi:hypothetical protein